MGLDMYLTGDKHYMKNYDNPEKNEQEDGFRIKSKQIDLGYWRKHPNLHGFIVNTFADGVDECQEISLSVEDMAKIIDAVKEKSLPETDGFFFGKSDGSEDEETIKIFTDAIAWLESHKGTENIWATVIYRASW